jgi:AraC family transcriptional regulator of adaptative response/methylated-DNA-[protein]-cysteine methyltransferase
MCRYLQAHADAPPTLDVLGARFNMSPFHLQRTFKRVVGMTPRQYSATQRIDHFKKELKAGGSVTTALYDAGYGSSSRAYEQAVDRLGMTPSVYRRGGANMQINYTTADSALGKVLVAATERGVCAVYLGDDEAQLAADLRTEYPAATIERDGEHLGAWVAPIVEYANGKQKAVDLPLDVQATAFQQRVWDALRTIPPGTTRTYSQIAAQLGRPGAARAVGRACATNPVSLIIPCHRAVGSDGKMHGYRWGMQRKQQLLAQERSVVTE